ncbi:type I-G CRISPR-associated protein Csb2 [Nocardiopsis lucentensis]|uniref:type I-G CRISPR-associated protein Csb2 n=1 Tax=Nocardiopsis lucentensis TaxID=53441 RepID=UPI00034C0B1D|nr:type I-U CRISPR-associated protein Csb2 [Nocardiopsis lucentensis]
MPLVMNVRLLNGRYDASDGWREHVEWPPAPSRLFCALVASALTEEERRALMWLEQQAPPQVWASREHTRVRSDGYAVTNTTSGKGGSQSLPGRTTAPRTRVAALPKADEFAFVWPEADPPGQVEKALADLAWKVPYLGRSTSTVAIRVHTSPTRRSEWTTYTPVSLGTPATRELGVPYPGYLDALNRAYEQGSSAWDVRRTIGYTTPNTPRTTVEAPVRGPFGPMLVFAFDEGTVRPSSGELLTFTDKLRDTLMSRIGDNIPGQVSGHTDLGRHHVAFLGLPDVGHRHAHGSLLGLAVALPTDLDPEVSQAVYQALVHNRLTHLNRGYGPISALTYQPEPSSRRTLNPARWTAPARGSRVWVSATPMMLDRFVRPNTDLAAVIARSVVTAGYPSPIHVEVSQAPMTRGAMQRPRRGTYPSGRTRRWVLHARIEFTEPVTGPVLVGSMRYLGLGLFEPWPTAPLRGTTAEHGREREEVVDAVR